MIELLQGACILIALVFGGSIIYAIWNAILTAKRNRQEEEIAQQFFLSQMIQSKNNNDMNATSNTNKPMYQFVAANQINDPKQANKLNYDEFENTVDVSQPIEKGLKDFFAAN